MLGGYKFQTSKSFKSICIDVQYQGI